MICLHIFSGDVNGKIFSDSFKSNSEKSFTKLRNGEFVSATRLECSSSETTSTSMTDGYSLKTRRRSSASSSCSGMSRSLSGSNATKNSSMKNVDIVLLDDSQDPFAFDEDDLEPSKWEVLSGKQNTSRTKRIGLKDREPDYGFQSRIKMSLEETSSGENNHSREASCSTSVDEERSSLLADCLLTAVKVSL